MIFLKVVDHTGSPGLVAVEKIIFISTDARSEDAEVNCRIHLDGTDNFVDVQNTLDDLITRITNLLGGNRPQAPMIPFDPILGR